MTDHQAVIYLAMLTFASFVLLGLVLAWWLVERRPRPDTDTERELRESLERKGR